MNRTGAFAWPYAAGLIALVALPSLATAFLAFTEYSGIEAPRFTGLDNLRRLASDADLRYALLNSAFYVAVAVPLRLVIATGVALLLHRRARGVPAARAVAYLPSVVPDAAYALLWLWILNPLYGPLPLLLDALGTGSPRWLTSAWGARSGVVLMATFQIGEAFVIALAARRAVPHRLYEAAAVDGASPFYALRRITLPLMAPVLALLALRDVVVSLQASFVPAFLVTGGGPNYATRFVPLYIYEQGFVYFRLGYAAAMSLLLFVLTAVIVYVQYRLARRWLRL